MPLDLGSLTIRDYYSSTFPSFSSRVKLQTITLRKFIAFDECETKNISVREIEHTSILVVGIMPAR